MPRENKKRGRRAQEKRKYDGEEPEDQPDFKRRKSFAEQDVVRLAAPSDAAAEDDALNTAPFYGSLDESEQEYFKHADDMLELNQFGSTEERDIFLNNIYREADGKELRIANSQSCSRLLERLILVSTPEQLKILFQKFSG